MFFVSLIRAGNLVESTLCLPLQVVVSCPNGETDNVYGRTKNTLAFACISRVSSILSSFLLQL